MNGYFPQIGNALPQVHLYLLGNMMTRNQQELRINHDGQFPELPVSDPAQTHDGNLFHPFNLARIVLNLAHQSGVNRIH